MATKETDTKCSQHIRCNSLPSAPHPIVSQLDEHLRRLKSTETSCSSSSVRYKLNSLQELHECTDKLFQLPSIQHDLKRDCCDELLEGSLKLLDICSSAKDALLQSEESIYELQSVFRRRRGGDSALTIEGGKYLASRKTVKKAIRKTFGNLKGIKNGFTLSLSDNDNETLCMLSILKETEAVTLSSLESSFMFISDQNGRTKNRKWSVLYKLMQPKRVACDSEDSDINEFEKVDVALQSLIGHKNSSIENFQKHMENLEMCIQDLEVGMERLSRQLTRTRVSLVNILNH